MSRRDRPAGDASPVEWVQADLRSGDDLPAAVDGIEILVHAATNVFTSKVDVQGTKLLLESAASARVQHFLYPSIVGIDSNPFPYYAGGRVADFGGPQVQRMAELWLASRGLQRKIHEFPIPGKAAQAFRWGDNLLKRGTQGKITWEEWLRQTYGARHFGTPRRPTRSS